jgi:4-hydroxybutyrate CoA-transferase
MWHKRSYAKRAKKVIVEVDANIPKMYGDNAIHVSEIDRFVENAESAVTWEEVLEFLKTIEPAERRASVEEFARRMYRMRLDMMRMFLDAVGPMLADPNFDIWSVAGVAGIEDPSPAAKGIAENLKEIIQDGDSFNIGVGRPSLYMVDLGVFDEKHDLGIYTEMGCIGLCLLVKRGIVTGKCRTFHTGRAIFSTLTGCGPEDVEFAAENPMFEVYDSEYVVNICNIAKVENMVAINNGLQVDLTGQICSETQFGPRMINGQGGQLEMHIGAFLAKGGRACTLLPATALGGAASTIVPHLEKGSLVTIQRHFADIIVTEHGIARLAGKNHRERANELIGVAHPDFRAELKKEAQKLFYP